MEGWRFMHADRKARLLHQLDLVLLRGASQSRIPLLFAFHSLLHVTNHNNAFHNQCVICQCWHAMEGPAQGISTCTIWKETVLEEQKGIKVWKVEGGGG